MSRAPTASYPSGPEGFAARLGSLEGLVSASQSAQGDSHLRLSRVILSEALRRALQAAGPPAEPEAPPARGAPFNASDLCFQAGVVVRPSAANPIPILTAGGEG